MKTLRALVRFTAFSLLSVFVVLLFSLSLPFCRLFNLSWINWKNRLISRWAGGITRIMGMTVHIDGPLPEPPFFLVSNHLSYLDILPFWKHLKTTFVAKDDIRAWPFFGFAAWVLGILFINRNNKRDLSRINRRIEQNLTEEQGVIVFPEGTSSKGENVLPFKSSLFLYPARHEVAVYAASVSYHVPPGSNHRAWEEICWWGDMPFLPHLWNVLKIKTFEVRVSFDAAAFHDSNRKKLCKTLQKSVEEQFVPTFT